MTTATKSSGAPAKGSTVVFDLGQTRTINSFEYFVPEASLGFIRNAVVEVADAPDAADADWKLVLDINSDGKIADPEHSRRPRKPAGSRTPARPPETCSSKRRTST